MTEHAGPGPQTPADRRNAILSAVRERGYVGAAELSAWLHVDSSTVRRDLERLERAGVLRRTRGGALPGDPADTIDTPYEVRRGQNAPVKAAIGEEAARLVKDGETVLIDNGSTTYELATALKHRRGLTVITNDLMIAMSLRSHSGNSVHLTGGQLLDTVFTLVGASAVRSLEGVSADWAFLGAEGVHPVAGITNINVIELPVKQAMIEAAARVAVLADPSKFGRVSLAHVCPIDRVDVLVSAGAVPDAEAYAGVLRLAGDPTH